MKQLLALLIACLCISRSYQLLRLSAEPVKVEIGVTKTLELRCALPPKNAGLNMTIASMMISRANATHDAHFQELVSVTAPDKIHNLAEPPLTNANVSGLVSTTAESYIAVSWQNPDESVVGVYRCFAFGVDDTGHPAQLVQFVIVSVESPDMDTFADRIRELTESADKMRKYYQYLGNKLNAAATLLK